MDLILDTGFDINARTARGTALHEAAICGKIDVVRRLLEAGINLELRDQQDKTVLEIMNELKTSRAREVIHIVLGKHNVEMIFLSLRFYVKSIFMILEKQNLRF